MRIAVTRNTPDSREVVIQLIGSLRLVAMFTIEIIEWLDLCSGLAIDRIDDFPHCPFRFVS